jgi:5'-nucleotidase / UDP-sugar diphosphatase
MNSLNVFLSLSALGLLSSCASTSLAPVQGTVKLTVLHTNDHHGRFWKNSDGEYGLAARKTLIDGLRAEIKAAGGQVLLLDGGDVNMGVPESDTQDAEPDFKGMRAMGYDAMALGNHEFDKPLTVLAKQMEWAGFPMLSANIYKQNGERAYKPYEIFERGGLKVAVVGLKAKAHVVIAATHMGHYVDGKSGVNAPGDVEMARQVKGFDLIVGGHSQNPVCMLEQLGALRYNAAYVPGTACAPDRQNGTYIVQAHEWGKYVGRADFEYKAGELKLVKYELLPVNLKRTVKGADGKDLKQTYTPEIKEDAAMLAMLQPYQDKGRSLLDVVVGESDGVLDGDRARVRSQPTNMGVFIASVMMQKAKAQVGIMNAGGVRDSMPAGKLTYKDVLKVQPFGNTLVYVDMLGSELNTYLEAAAKMTAGSGAFAQFAGVRLEIDKGVLQSVMVGNEALNPKATYRLALNSFQAGGGDGYPRVNNHPGYVNTGFVDADVMREYLSKNKIQTANFAPGTAVLRR